MGPRTARIRVGLAWLLGLLGLVLVISLPLQMPYPSVPGMRYEELVAARGTWWLGASWISLWLSYVALTVGLPPLVLGRWWGAAVLVASPLLMVTSGALVGDPPLYLLPVAVAVGIAGWVARGRGSSPGATTGEGQGGAS